MKKIIYVMCIFILTCMLIGCKNKKVTVTGNPTYNNKTKEKQNNKKDKQHNDIKQDPISEMSKYGDLFNNIAGEEIFDKYNCKECLEPVEGYHAYDTILSGTNNSLKLAPFDYDGDVKEFKEYIEEVKISKKAVFYEISITNREKIDKKEYIHDCSYKKISKEEAIASLEDSSAGAFVWFNDDKEILKVVFYGGIIISE